MTVDRDPTTSKELHDAAIMMLTRLCEASHYLDGVVHMFELRLLEVQGYAPVLDHCVKCGEPLARKNVGFSPSLGGALCSADRFGTDDALPMSIQAISVLQRMQSGRDDLTSNDLPSARIAAEIARALRWYVRFHVDRGLKSADFLDQLRAST